MVTVSVGPLKETFYAHKKLLCSASEYFRRAYTSGLAEAQSNTFWLEDDDPNVFTLFMIWLYYSGNLVLCSCSEAHPLDFEKVRIAMKPGQEPAAYNTTLSYRNMLAQCWNTHVSLYLRLWVFCDKRVVGQCQNYVIEKLHDLFSKTYKPPLLEDTVDWIWNNTTEQSNLRVFLRKAYAFSLYIKETTLAKSLLVSALVESREHRPVHDAWREQWKQIGTKQFFV